jgi:nicotinate-nucleotide adenylyltransferase
LKIALFGGSFDPIHNGHMACAKAVYQALGCDEFIFMPTFISPFKRKTLFTAKQRHELILTMLPSLKINAKVSSFEINRESPSWTIDTLLYIKENNPHTELFLCCGADTLASMPEWKRAKEISDLATIVCYPRGGVGLSDPAGFRVMHLDGPLFPCSSTDIRHKLIEKMDVSDDLPAGILNKVKEFMNVNRINR